MLSPPGSVHPDEIFAKQRDAAAHGSDGLLLEARGIDLARLRELALERRDLGPQLLEPRLGVVLHAVLGEDGGERRDGALLAEDQSDVVEHRRADRHPFLLAPARHLLLAPREVALLLLELLA